MKVITFIGMALISILPANIAAASLFYIYIIGAQHENLPPAVPHLKAFLENATDFLMFGTPVCVLMVLVIALPAYLFARQLKLLSPTIEILGGGIVPVVSASILNALGWHFPSILTLNGIMFYASAFLCGCIGGVTFRLLSLWLERGV